MMKNSLIIFIAVIVSVSICFFSNINAQALTINDTLGPGDVLKLNFSTQAGQGILPNQPNQILLSVGFDPSVVQSDYLNAELFLGSSTSPTNSGIVWSFDYGENFTWYDSTTSGWFSFLNPVAVDFTNLLSGTTGLLELSLASSNSVYVKDVQMLYGYSADGGGSIYVDQSLLNYAATISPIPEPTTILLFSLGLLGFAGVSRRKE